MSVQRIAVSRDQNLERVPVASQNTLDHELISVFLINDGLISPQNRLRRLHDNRVIRLPRFGQCASSASLLQKGRHVIKTRHLGKGNKGLQRNLAGKVARLSIKLRLSHADAPSAGKGVTFLNTPQPWRRIISVCSPSPGGANRTRPGTLGATPVNGDAPASRNASSTV